MFFVILASKSMRIGTFPLKPPPARTTPFVARTFKIFPSGLSTSTPITRPLASLITEVTLCSRYILPPLLSKYSFSGSIKPAPVTYPSLFGGIMFLPSPPSFHHTWCHIPGCCESTPAVVRPGRNLTPWLMAQSSNAAVRSTFLTRSSWFPMRSALLKSSLGFVSLL